LNRKRGASELSQASSLSDGLTGPIFSACDNRGLLLYVADPVPDVDGSPDGAVVSFKIDRETGGLTRLNRKACGEEVPCYLSVSRNGKFILVASYGSGSVSVLPIGENGSLGDVVCSVKHDVPPGERALTHPPSFSTRPTVMPSLPTWEWDVSLCIASTMRRAN